jgi:chromosome segregation ATPase
MKHILISLALLPLIACTADYDDAENSQGLATSSAESESDNLAAAERRLGELESEVSGIKAEIAGLSAEESAKLQDLVAAVEAKRQTAADRIAAWKESGEVASGTASESVQYALDDFEGSIDEIWNRIQ